MTRRELLKRVGALVGTVLGGAGLSGLRPDNAADDFQYWLLPGREGQVAYGSEHASWRIDTDTSNATKGRILI